MTPDEIVQKAVDDALLRAANQRCGTNYKSWDDVPKARPPHHRDLSFIKPAGDFPSPWHWRLYFGLRRVWVRARRVWRRVTGR